MTDIWLYGIGVVAFAAMAGFDAARDLPVGPADVVILAVFWPVTVVAAIAHGLVDRR